MFVVEMLHEEDSIQMVHLVLKESSLELVGLDAHLVPVDVSTDDVDQLRSYDRPGKAAHRKATLLVLPFAVGIDDFRVDEDPGVLTEFEVIHEHALSDPDLWCGQSQPWFLVHRLEHVFGQLDERAVDIGDLTSHLFQYRVAILPDLIRTTHGIQGYRWLVVSESTPAGHYFDETPSAPSRRRSIELVLPDVFLTLTTDSGVFSRDNIDAGTRFLLQQSPPIASSVTSILDIGCGYGPIALTAAARSPASTVWAVDTNERARALTTENAEANNLTNIIVAAPEDVPADLSFDLIISNPPIRIGKVALHDLLEWWLSRLAVNGRAWLVVQKHLGSDSLADWLNESGWPTERLNSRKGFRLLEVMPREES